LTLQIGEQLHLPVFNLNAYQMDEYLNRGREKIAPLYSDHNHTYIPGAQQLSKFVVAGLKSFKNSPLFRSYRTRAKRSRRRRQVHQGQYTRGHGDGDGSGGEFRGAQVRGARGNPIPIRNIAA